MRESSQLADQPGVEVLDGRCRVVIDDLRPAVDDGKYPVKRVVGDRVRVEATLLVDGHDKLAGRLRYRRASSPDWNELPLRPVAPSPGRETAHGDGWGAEFVVDAVGPWEYTVCGWVDPWDTWVWAVERKVKARQDVALELRGAATLIGSAAARAAGEAGDILRRLGEMMADPTSAQAALKQALSPETLALMRAYPDRSAQTVHAPALALTVDRARARFSSWYELFPRSCAPPSADEPLRHGTFKDAERRLPYVAQMGFDVLYLPPIHPIGRSHRKGPDDSLLAGPDDPGSPWAIGSGEGGHKAVHPQLGTLEDFHHFVRAAADLGLDVALDIALQASPDHPYVKEHPEWFVHRADDSIQFAENPPKKYQDIYPFDFGGAAWASLWQELESIFEFWIAQGITIFRVDNPHTKPLPFWRWCIGRIKARHPEVIFLAEAFTRPKLLYALAKAGFSQSYTYFAWRASKAELTTFVRSMVDTSVREFFRPNFWPNTPDILPEQLQVGSRATFISRAVLAATLSPSWGVYGPVYELQERTARAEVEEYAQNEKYQLRSWHLDRPENLAPILERLNRIRRDNPALQRLEGTVFHDTDNEALICYSRALDEPEQDALVVVVNLDPHNRQSGWLTLDATALGLPSGARFQVHDLLSDARYLWDGPRAFVALDPQTMPAHIFRVRRLLRNERSFEYYL